MRAVGRLPPGHAFAMIPYQLVVRQAKEKPMLVCGIDVGARSTEVALLDASAPDSPTTRIADTGHDPARTGRRVFDEALAERGASPADVACTVATGYGRASLPFATKAVTEITCHARGVRL